MHNFLKKIVHISVDHPRWLDWRLCQQLLSQIGRNEYIDKLLKD